MRPASPQPAVARAITDFDIAPSVTVIVSDELEAAYNQIKPVLALYIGGMGAKGKNFYYDLACRFGFEEAADEISGLVPAGAKRRSDDGGA